MMERTAAETLSEVSRKTGGQLDIDFDGPAYDPDLDRVRLAGQLLRVWDAMVGGLWWTLDELSERTGDPPASISAQMRHLRKDKFGAHTIEKRRRGLEDSGLWEYRLIPNPRAQIERRNDAS